ncbi:MAG: hypothetical protein K2X32_01555 [Phycisphaerales bacterium]|nr:hypothetical protein [Phycisphaerales bacterium]
MNDRTLEGSGRASALAARLRLLQAELADRPAEVRAQELRGEIDRASQGLSADQRSSLMETLAEQFPRSATDGAVAPRASGAPVAVPKPPPPAGPADTPKLAEEIAALWPMLTEDLRQRVRAALGPVMPAPAAGGDVRAPEWRKQLGLNADDPVDPARAIELGLALMTLSVNIDRVVCGVWKDTNTGGEFKRAENLKTIAGQFLRQWQGAGSDKMQAEVNDLQLLLYAILKALQLFPTMFADRHLARFDPAVVMANTGIVGERGTSWFGDSGKAASAKCWEEYQRLMKDYDKNSLADEVKAMVTDEVYKVLRQRRR